MQHAVDTNRKDRARKAARREKFNANHSDKTTLDGANAKKLDFSHLTPEQIAGERQRIEKLRVRRSKKNRIVFTISIAMTVSLLIACYYLWLS